MTGTEPSPTPPPAPAPPVDLVALERLTRGHALTAHALFGLATVPCSLLLALAAVAHWQEAHLLGAALALAAPPVLWLTGTISQPRYQRLGRAIGSDARPEVSHPPLPAILAWIGSILLAGWVLVALLGVAFLEPGSVGPMRRAVRFTGLASALATGGLIAWRRPRPGDGSWLVVPFLGLRVTGGLGSFILETTADGVPGSGPLFDATNPAASPSGLYLTDAVLLLLWGVSSHLIYLRLLRRFRADRDPS